MPYYGGAFVGHHLANIGGVIGVVGGAILPLLQGYWLMCSEVGDGLGLLYFGRDIHALLRIDRFTYSSNS